MTFIQKPKQCIVNQLNYIPILHIFFNNFLVIIVPVNFKLLEIDSCNMNYY